MSTQDGSHNSQSVPVPEEDYKTPRDTQIARELARGMPKNLSRLQRLFWRIQEGYEFITPRESQLAELCEKYGISLGSAYRHLRNGTRPTIKRKAGKDGKSYPARSERKSK